MVFCTRHDVSKNMCIFPMRRSMRIPHRNYFGYPCDPTKLKLWQYKYLQPLSLSQNQAGCNENNAFLTHAANSTRSSHLTKMTHIACQYILRFFVLRVFVALAFNPWCPHNPWCRQINLGNARNTSMILLTEPCFMCVSIFLFEMYRQFSLGSARTHL